MKNSTQIFTKVILSFALFGISLSSQAITIVEFNYSARVNLDTPLKAVLVVGNTESGTASSIKKNE